MHTIQNDQQNSRTPLVSFIITTYNLPHKMLAECLESILRLTLRPYEREIILVDDGSQASPLTQLSQYVEEIIYIRQTNKGLSEARNTGIRMASGQYMQFVDGDDKLIQPAYEHCLDIARYNAPDMVIFNFTDKENDKSSYQDPEPMSGTEYMRRHNLRPTACGYLFKQAILGELRFTPGIYHEDEEFTPQLLLRAETVQPTDAKAYMYRHRPQSITTAKDKRSIVKRLNDTQHVITRLHSLAHTLPHNDRMAMQRRVAQLTMDYIYNIIVQTGDEQYLYKRLEELRRQNLYPLPDKDYTAKYKWFRRMTNSRLGLTILLRTLPLMRR